MSAKPMVHIIDDDEAVRDSLAFLLGTSDFVVKTYESARRFLDQLDGPPQGFIITDLRMPEVSGIELLEKLNAMGSRAPVIVMTGHGDVPLAVEAMKAGAIDFIEKPFEEEQMLAAVAAAARREGQINQHAADRSKARARIEALSNRERQVLERIVAGQANKIIAFELGISPRTVEVYRASLMTKMQAASLSDLVRMALQAGLNEGNSASRT